MNAGEVAPMEPSRSDAMSDESRPVGSTRFCLDAEVQVGRVHAAQQVAGRMLEVGTDGCQLHFPAPVDLELRTTIDLVMRVGIVKIRSLGTVAWIGEDGREIEVAFVEMGGRGRADLQALLQRLPIVKPKVLLAEGQALAEAQGVTTDAPALEVRLRRHRRYEHETVVSVAYTGSMMQFRGVTANLSAGGCLVLFTTPCELSMDSQVELWMQAATGMFKVTGRLRRRTRDECGIGVEFEGSSTRSLREVEKLIGACIRRDAQLGRSAEVGSVEDRVSG
jgi:hypothetical protein